MNVIRTMRVESNVRRRSSEPQRPVDLYEPRRGGQGARGDLSHRLDANREISAISEWASPETFHVSSTRPDPDPGDPEHDWRHLAAGGHVLAQA